MKSQDDGRAPVGPDAHAADRLGTYVGPLANATLARMEAELPWYRELSASDRSWIGVVAQNGISAFVKWLREGGREIEPSSAYVFGIAPTALARVVSLEQTVAMVRMTIAVVESRVEELLGPRDGATVRAGIVLFSREVAFAAAEVYARAAEVRGAWDARLEALVVDSLLRGEADEALRSRAAALGWQSSSLVTVVLGHAPDTPGDVIEHLRRSARHVGLDALCAVQGDRLVAVLGGVNDPEKAGAAVAEHFGTGPVVVGPLVDDLLTANVSARAAVAGLRAAPGWPQAPRPVAADDLLPERALSGDGHARHHLVSRVYQPLLQQDAVLLHTASAFVDAGCSVERSARVLIVHPNTVRYRLRRVEELTGLAPSDPRDAYTLRVAITLGRLLAPQAVRPSL
uniref:Regulator of polyketide synthase expression n=1 Tax=uncultured Nocardioidaceae bacterium TaxID=253824 RepID=A0A6J4LGI3_9ACTN|nr:MAG: Regulator of polyketide synthase expression [uncultured Nocardioidaceae bacterium]